MQELFLSPDLIIRSVLGFAVGALIGLERQKRMSEGDAIGVRSFGLHSLLGTLAAYTYTVTGNAVVLIYAIAISLVFVTAQIVYKIFRTMRKGMTTAIVFAISFVLGTLVGLDEPPTPPHLIGPLAVLAMTVSFLVFLVLGFKEELSAVVAVITREEMISAVELAVLILFLWPLMPQFIQIGTVNFPIFQTYWLIVLLLSISFANYLLIKKYKHKGPYFFGFFGGFANSEATVASLTDFHVKTERQFTGRVSLGAIFANLAMVLRNTVIIILFDHSLAVMRYYLIPLGILVLVGVTRMFSERNEVRDDVTHDIDIRLVSPFEFGAAFRFAAVFTVVSFISIALQNAFSDVGILVAALFGGFTSAGAVVAIAVPAYSHHIISLQTAVFAVIITTTISVLNKIIYVYTADHEGTLARRVAKDSLIMAVGVVVYLLLIAANVISLV
ncbi:MAG: DUF4010 domain-containing protein [Candidatus Thorarchaeota archaeon]|nr:DUF4010 domain-containing protein [Candidatus Thorarchaeota archaeon]